MSTFIAIIFFSLFINYFSGFTVIDLCKLGKANLFQFIRSSEVFVPKVWLLVKVSFKIGQLYCFNASL